MIFKRMMASLLAIALVMTMVFSFSSCGGSPDSKFRKAEEQALDHALDEIFEYYDQVEAKKDQSLKGAVSVKIGSTVTTLLNLMLGTDISWVNDMNMNVTLTNAAEHKAASLALSLGENDLLSLAAILAPSDGMLYVSVPELFSKYLGITLPDAELPQGMDMKALLDKLPDEKALRSLVKKYAGLIFDSIADVTEAEETLTIDGVSQTFPVLTLSLREKDVAVMVKNVLTEAKSDESIKTILYTFVDAYNEMLGTYDESVSADEIYGEFCQFVDETVAEADAYIADETESNEVMVVVKDYLGKKDVIVGREITVDEDGFRLFHGTVTADGETRGVFSLTADGEEIFSVNSDLSAEDGIQNGTVEFVIGGKSIFYIDVTDMNVERLEDGCFKGTITLAPSTGLSDILKDAMGDLGLPINLMTFAIRVDMEVTEKKSDISLTLVNGTDEYVTLNASVEMTDTAKITLPDENEIETDVDEWMNHFDFNGFITGLREAGVPEDVVNLLDGLVKTIVGA